MNSTLKKETTIIEALQTLYPDSSKRSLLNWMAAGRVYVNDTPVKRKNVIVSKGQKLEVRPKKELFSSNAPILYKDTAVIVIEKPSGLLSVPTDYDEEPNALEYLRDHFQDDSIYAVHRIDREVSGVMVFARGKLSAKRLCEMMRKKEIEREYIALVEGKVRKERGRWKSFLRQDKNFQVKSCKSERLGKQAITHYQVIERFEGKTLLRLQLKTGRKHQIRVHCSDAKNPIVGDTRYGSQYPADRLFLHSARLHFMHPITHKAMEFLSPCPFKVPL